MKNKISLTLFMMLFISIITAGIIDLDQLFMYANQTKPAYIGKDNTPFNNPITDEGATLGRVLFYDKKLSLNNSIACAGCHLQEFAFGDTAKVSLGLLGESTGRHSMRLVNNRFGIESRFFWDERASSLENQTTQPIQDHVEMGYSGLLGHPAFDSLTRKLEQIEYYPRLFNFAFGSTEITEQKIALALSQFIRSIQSFDSKFDVGRALVPTLGAPFPNFSADENAGKQLYLTPPINGGAGCQGCHNAPEFDIDLNSLNNGVLAVAGSNTELDLTNTRAPSLRNLFNPSGNLNGNLMHNGNFTTINQVIDHYNLIPPNPNNTNLDPRLAGPGGNLQLSNPEKNQLIAFLRTLTGNDVYTNPKWSNPFDNDGSISILPDLSTNIKSEKTFSFQIFPNPSNEIIRFDIPQGEFDLNVYNLKGQLILREHIQTPYQMNISNWDRGIYILHITGTNGKTFNSKLVKN